MKIPSTFQLNHDKNVLMNQVSFTYLINYSIILSQSNMRWNLLQFRLVMPPLTLLHSLSICIGSSTHRLPKDRM